VGQRGGSACLHAIIYLSELLAYSALPTLIYSDILLVFLQVFLGVPRMSIGKLFLLSGPRPSIALLPPLALSETHLLLTTASRISSLSRLVQHFTRSQVVADPHELVG
jgi:hypothetical protein